MLGKILIKNLKIVTFILFKIIVIFFPYFLNIIETQWRTMRVSFEKEFVNYIE